MAFILLYTIVAWQVRVNIERTPHEFLSFVESSDFTGSNDLAHTQMMNIKQHGAIMVPQIYPPSSNPRASDLGQRCTVRGAQRLKSRKTKLHRLSVHLSEPFGPCDIIGRTHNQ